MGKISDFKKYVSDHQNGQYKLVKGNPQIVTDEMTIKCKKCYQHFETTPHRFKRRKTCYCSGLGLPITFEEFKKRANEIYNNKYEYNSNGYLGLSSSISAQCPKHGLFTIKNCGDHIHKNKNTACPQCGKESFKKNKSISYDEFLKRCEKKHGDKFIYKKDSYSGITGHIIFFCKKHGEQTQLATHHLRGYGCPKCGDEKTAEGIRRDGKEILSELKNLRPQWDFIFNPKKYKSRLQKIDMKCENNHVFKRKIGAQLSANHNCPFCSNRIPNALIELIDYLEMDEDDYEVNYRGNSKYEIDLFFPKLNKGIEYHGLLFHCDSMNSVFRSVDKEYHLKKHKEYLINDYEVLQVFEDEYIYKKDILFDMIRDFIFPNKRKKIKSQDVEYRVINNNIVNNFYTNNSVLFKINDYDLSYGLFIKNILFAVCSVKNNEVFFLVQLGYSLDDKVFNNCLKLINKRDIYFKIDRRYECFYQDLLNGLMDYDLTICDVKAYYFKNPDKIRFLQDKINYNEENDYVKKGYYRVWDCGDLIINIP